MTRWLILALLALVALCAACDRQGGAGQGARAPGTFKNTDITGIDYGKDFALTDHTGQARRLADFKGKVVVLFFGYTQCPDVCPTTMAQLAQAMEKLGPAAAQVQVLFVTLDPQRDTQQLLAQYVPAFDARFLGLRGNEADIEKTAREFKVFYQRSPGATADSYTIDHSTGTYIFDRDGRLRLYVRHGQDADAIAQDIRILLK